MELLRGPVPKLLKSETLAKRTLRMAWHLTTLLLFGFSFLFIVLSRSPLDETGRLVLWILSIIFYASSVVSLILSRGKHFSWIIFFLIALFATLGS